MLFSPTTLGIPSQELLKVGTQRDIWSPLRLEGLRKQLTRQARSERSRDQIAALQDCRFEFDPAGGAYVRFRGRSRFGRRHPMTSHAVKQVATLVSTPRSLALFEDLVCEGEDADLRLATRVLQRLALRSQPERKLRFRTAVRDCGWNKKVRIVTAILTEQYQPYDDAEFVTELVEQIPDCDKLPVLGAWRTSEGFSLRLSLSPEEPEQCKPFPMVEFRNSEVGSGATTLSSGLFTLVCTNGMHSWDDYATYRWPHRGETGRVREEISAALERARCQAEAVQSDYEQGSEVLVGESAPQVQHWLQQQSRRLRLSQRFIRGVIKALDDPTTSLRDDGSFHLASVVDAVTLYAQTEPFAERYDMERLAGRLLQEGLRRHHQQRTMFGESGVPLGGYGDGDVPF